MRKPYRVALWGPGDMGSCIIREILRLPELDLVAVYVYSESKDGVDVGILVGTAPIGIKATRSLDDFLAVESDVVIYTARDYVNGACEADFVKLLEAGKNVITSLPYNHPQSRGLDVLDKIDTAAKRGGASFLATGINPGYVAEKWALTMTGLSNDVTQIKIQEYFDCIRQKNAGTLQVIGLGGNLLEAAKEDSLAFTYQRNYFIQLIEMIGAKLNIQYSRIEGKCKSKAAPVDLHSPVMNIKKGETGHVCYEWIGYVGDAPFFVLELNWYLTPTMKPSHVPTDDHWVVTIEGRPSLRVAMDIKASFQDESKSLEGEPAAPGYMANAMPILQSIPSVVSAPPGVMESAMPSVHWKPDMRIGQH